MILKTKQTTEHEVEITIPFFRKRVEYGMTEYFAMLTEGYTHSFSKNDNSMSVAIYPKWVKEGDIVKAFKEWEEITEEDFLAEYKRILSSLSLEPTLVSIPAANADDLKGINI